MNYTIKLLIPVALGIAAAATNWISISARTQPKKFTVAARPIKEGQLISVGDLAAVDIPANQAGNLDKTAIPYKQMSTLSGQVALRSIEMNDLIFWSDAPVRGPRLDRQTGDRFAVSVPMGRIRTAASRRGRSHRAAAANRQRLAPRPKVVWHVPDSGHRWSKDNG